MKLRSRLLIQNIIVAAVTVFVTAALGLLFTYVSEKSKAHIIQSDTVTVVRNGDVLYKSGNLSEFEIKSAIADYEMGKNKTVISNEKYLIKTQENEDRSYVLRLIPLTDGKIEYYWKLIVFLICVFVVTYLSAIYITGYLNSKDIAKPIVKLSEDALRLADGELSIPTVNSNLKEINDLALSIEKLRLKLSEAVYDKRKYDENRKFLISGISHDLKTPITAIRGYIEGVCDGVVKSEEKEKSYLKAAIRKIDIVKNMIDDLLLYSKLDLNQIPFSMQKVNIFLYIKECAEDIKKSFELDGKAFEFAGGAEKVNVEIDTLRFRRVIENVCDNAKKNILPTSGKVKISLRETKKCVIIEIADNGCGISKENLKNVFERFYRGDNARKNDGSSGLGLTIARSITEGMQGKIWATSREGEGTNIMISLRKV